MRHSPGWTLSVALILTLFSPAGGDEPEAAPAAPRRMATTPEAIRFFEARVERNPRDVMSRTTIGWLLLRLARETGDEEHTQRAEAELRRVLEDRPGHAAARAWLATALLARHEFAAALELAEAVYREHPGSTHALATIGDACLELGRYDEAQTAYRKLEESGALPEVLARLARIAELHGRTEEAIGLLERAAAKERESATASSEIAWYEFRLGEVNSGAGRLDQAARHLEAALERRADYVAALLGLGRVRAMQGRFAEAIPLYERVIARKPDFDIVDELALVHDRAGHAEEAQRLNAQVEALLPEAARVETEARHVALFLADVNRQVDQALALAEQDFNVRQDIYACDTLAWALYRNGKLAEADAAAQQALRLGTRDATLHFHAGMIAHDLGRHDDARRLLAQALEINPQFSLRHAELARRTLDSLSSADPE
jgi:tetratricopeptide (TPR) repeat protein